MQAFKDVLLPQLMHNIEENILVRSDDRFRRFISSIEQFLRYENNIVNYVLIVLEKGKSERSESIVERKSVVGNDHPFSIVNDCSFLN